MQKTMIVLRGICNVGKTKTIRLAYEELRNEAVCLHPGRGYKEVRGAILEIGGVRVGFFSLGDLPGKLELFLDALIKAGCVVIVCASHTSRSRTVEVVERLAREAEPPFTVIPIHKHSDGNAPADHSSGNRRMADRIIEEVRKAIANAQPAEAQLAGV